jgi:6-phosphogluconate dehydrogenase (decarboxylating)
MELGMIGLGRMGAHMTERPVKGGHDEVELQRMSAWKASADSHGPVR